MKGLSQRRMTYREMVIAREEYERRRLREEHQLLYAGKKRTGTTHKQLRRDRQHEHAIR